jgi:phosphatidylserine/phosphatidylglycerophosphate/cardiolipin synthase-like enzyme
MEVYFTSLSNSGTIRRIQMDLIKSTIGVANRAKIELNIMMFSFTDAVLGGLLETIARDNDSVYIRVIADWKQGSQYLGSQVKRLEELRLQNIEVRYKADQPYKYDKERHRLCWSYRTSRGLLHHKTVSVRVNNRPSVLICGTYNWTNRATKNYENLLIFKWIDKKYRSLISRLDLEFEALWKDASATMSASDSLFHYKAIKHHFDKDPDVNPQIVIGKIPMTGGKLDKEYRTNLEVTKFAIDDDACIAFSSRRYMDDRSGNGYAQENRQQMVVQSNGRRKPLTITQISLLAINGAVSGEHIYIAMHGLSPRVPEFSAIIDAARRGVHCELILDGKTSGLSAVRLEEIADNEALPLDIRVTSRFMHQKYLVHLEKNTVMTGTANMSTDASVRHTEHRMLIRNEPELTKRFLEDFAEIKRRLE